MPWAGWCFSYFTLLPVLAAGENVEYPLLQFRELGAAERRERVRGALARLSLRDREIVLLKFHGQLSNVELARALGISESNAGSRLHRALERLRSACLELDREEVA